MSVFGKIWKSKFWLPITIIALVVLNWLASLYHARIDFTNEKRFTLSAPTKKILRNLDAVVEVDVFLTGDFPSGFKKLALSTNEILGEFKEIAGNNLQYNFISPDELMPGTAVSWGDTLSATGLYPFNLKSQLKEGEKQQLVYPFALMRYKGKTMPIRLYNGIPNIGFREINNAEALMEYELANGIYKLGNENKPMVAYSAGNGEPPVGSYITYDLVENVLRPDYNLFTFNLNAQALIPDTFKLLMIVKPTKPFSEEAKLKIDQFVMRGGKVLFFIDKLNAEMDSLRIKNEVIAYDRGLELNDLFFRYGARINSDLVMDLQSDRLPFDVNGDGQFEFLTWNYFPVFASASDHVINRNLGFVSGKFVNSMDTTGAEGIKKTSLLSSSQNSRSIATPALISGRENVNAPRDEKFNKANIPVAVLLEGRFKSLFANRLSQAFNDSLSKYGSTFIPQCLYDNKMIIVADGDIPLNSMQQNEPLPMGMNPFTYNSQYQYQFANKNFVQNCLDYLINTSNLTEAKAKEYTLRLLDKKKVEAEKITWLLINILVPVIGVLLFALAFQFRRKRKYTINLNG
ncbi:MAG: gliding motility-associated ABC transporter substrate-binding protein GldG [Chitinophagaceae bacterium]|nr:gliding motility-associated ABC transporter substrate-binding protein GldG [Chitinophagaceae bacterium]